jgi:hypothetical protein
MIMAPIRRDPEHSPEDDELVRRAVTDYEQHTKEHRTRCDHFYAELQLFLFKCEREVSFIANSLLDEELTTEARDDLVKTQQQFQVSASAATTALEYLDTAATQLLHAMRDHDDPATRDIAHNYTKDGTLDF